MDKIGVLLTNTGTPDAPTIKAVRAYLKEFLSDRRVIKLPKFIWYPILYGFVLPLRPYRSAKLYQKIWREEGSPMRIYMQQLADALKSYLSQKNDAEFHVTIGMNYGSPSIPTAIAHLKKIKVNRIITIPLYPQFSETTTAAAKDRIAHHKDTTITFINHYADNEHYLEALTAQIKCFWNRHGKSEKLLISFHGIPQRYVAAGDPYQQQCEHTANQIAARLKLPQSKWVLCYQSRFGYDQWLQPSTQFLLKKLPQQGIKTIDVICPGFAVDCLETLEEIAIKGKDMFLQAGGKDLRYIAALNDSPMHIKLLVALLQKNIDSTD